MSFIWVGSMDKRQRERLRRRAAGAASGARSESEPRTGPRASRERGRRRRAASRGEQGVALILAMSAVAILSVVIADMHETSTTAFVVATGQRDRLKAEYLARSGLNLTRLVVAQEPAIRQIISPLYQAMLGRAAPMVPVWRFADQLLRPFCDYGSMEESGLVNSVGVDFQTAEGMGDTGGTCHLVAFAENGRVNVNVPLSYPPEIARRSVAENMFALVGGFQSPSPYDPLFAQRDAEGQYNTRLDVVSALIDWWDIDTQRHAYDPGAQEITVSGAEDDVYSRYDDPYQAKNAAFDSIEELRLIRGVTDDFWATFLEPDPDDLQSRVITIYGSGAVNPNEARPETLLARVCSVLRDQLLCTDPIESAKFIRIMETVNMLTQGIPLFTIASDFIRFLQGQGGDQDLYPMLRGYLGEDNPLLFRPITPTAQQIQQLDNLMVTAARILTVESTGQVGRTTVRIRTVMNFDERWHPPPPNPGNMPGLGIYYYYRID